MRHKLLAYIFKYMTNVKEIFGSRYISTFMDIAYGNDVMLVIGDILGNILVTDDNSYKSDNPTEASVDLFL